MSSFRIPPDLDMHYRVDDFTDPWRTPQTILMLHGNAESGVSLSAFGGGGITLVRSHKFYLVSQQAKHIAEEGVPYNYEGEHLGGNAPTATGGLRIGLHSPDGIAWWLTGKLNWTKLNQFNQDALHELSTNRFEPKGLDPISSVLGFALQLGVSL